MSADPENTRDVTAVYDVHGHRQVMDMETTGEAWAFLAEGMFSNRCAPVGVVVGDQFEAWNPDRV